MSQYIALTDCVDRRLYRVKARNFSIAVFFKERSAFAGIRHKFGSVFIDEETHWDRAGSCKPLVMLPESLPKDQSTREFLDVMIKRHKRPAAFVGRAMMKLTPPEDPTRLDKALWTAEATAGPWTSGPVMRYDPRMAAAAAWEALGAALRAAGPPEHGWSASKAVAVVERAKEKIE